MVDRQRTKDVTQGLRALQQQSLSIIRLSEPITAGNAESHQRSSDVSSSTFENPSPTSLEADLSHYKLNDRRWHQELFSKLRFSYLEQVTKEKFLRAIVGDPPQIVEPGENAALEAHLAETKQLLRAQKQEVADLVADLEAQARELSRRHETITLQTELLSQLPDQIEGLNQTIAELRAKTQPGGHDDDGAESKKPEMNLPLEATRALMEDRTARVQELDAQLKALRQGVPRQTRLIEQEERELKSLEAQRARTVGAAQEAMERKNAGGGMDEMEVNGRWLKSAERGLKDMLDVNG